MSKTISTNIQNLIPKLFLKHKNYMIMASKSLKRTLFDMVTMWKVVNFHYREPSRKLYIAFK